MIICLHTGRDDSIIVEDHSPVTSLDFGAISKKIGTNNYNIKKISIGRPMETESTQEISKCVSI